VISSSRKNRVDDAVSRLQKAYPSAGKNASGYAYDMGTRDTLESNIVELLEKCGKLDHMVWTAGDALAAAPLDKVDMDFAVQAGMTRFFGPLMMAKHAPKYLNPGPESSIVLTTGSVSEKPIPGWSAIAGFATGLQGLNRSLALDLKPIRVNLVSPGAVDTELWAGMSEEARKAQFKAFEEKSLTGRVGQVTDVVESFLYLMKDRNVTGAMISTSSGGLLA